MGWMHRALRALGALALVALATLTPAVDAQIRVGQAPFRMTVNPVTNRIYVPNSSDGTEFQVSVIDGATDMVIATIPVGLIPRHIEDVAVNPITNRIYAATDEDSAIFVIDGARNTVIATVPVGERSFKVAVNPTTNRVYVRHEDRISVLDGATNTVVATIPVNAGNARLGMASNPAINRIYVSLDSDVAVIDGASHTVIATIPAGGGGGGGVDVDPATNRIYFAHLGGLSVIDGASNAVVATIPVAGSESVVAFNPSTNRLYVRIETFDIPSALAVIDAASHTVLDIFAVDNDRSSPGDVAVNPATNRVYVALPGRGAVWVTEDPPRIGGMRFGISPRPEGVLLTWTAGILETGYRIARWRGDTGTFDLLPRASPLPAGTTSFTDQELLTEAVYLYALLALDASGVLSVSDFLGLQTNTQAGESAPREFTLRYTSHALSGAGAGLVMTWHAAGPVDEYGVFAMDSQAIGGDWLFSGNRTSIAYVVSGPKCFMVWAAVMASPIGNTHSLCFATLASMMAGP